MYDPNPVSAYKEGQTHALTSLEAVPAGTRRLLSPRSVKKVSGRDGVRGLKDRDSQKLDLVDPWMTAPVAVPRTRGIPTAR
jgi:hypothetical protein